MRTILLAALCLGSYAQAQFKTVDAGDKIPKQPFYTEAAVFKKDDPASIAPNTILYRYRLQEFSNWNSADKKLLNLFEKFAGNPERPQILYIAKASMIINKPANQVSLKPFVTLGEVKTVDMKVFALDPKDIITNIEAKSAYRNPPAPAKWCDSGNNNTLCTFTRYILPGPMQAKFTDQAEAAKSKYPYLEAQGQTKIIEGNDITNANDLMALTGVSETKPTGVAIQDAFWYTHVLGFSKNLFVFQPNPVSPANQTLVTVFMVFSIEHKRWDMVVDAGGIELPLKDFFLSRSGLNRKEGLAKGLLDYTRETLEIMANKFAK